MATIAAPSSSPFASAPEPDAGSQPEGGNRNNGSAAKVDDLLARWVQGAHATIDQLAQAAAPHVHRLQDGVAAASETLHQRADQVQSTGAQWAENLRSTVRENPLVAVATALAVGALIGRISR